MVCGPEVPLRMIALLRAIPLWAYILAGALVVVGAQQVRISAQKAQTALADIRTAEAKGQLETFRREAAEAVAASQAEARQQEQRHAADLERVAYQYEQDKRNAQAVADRVVADLRSGATRLQDRWQACAAASGLPNSGPTPGQSDAGADDRGASASRIVRAAAACDAQVRGLQEVVRSDRK